MCNRVLSGATGMCCRAFPPDGFRDHQDYFHEPSHFIPIAIGIAKENPTALRATVFFTVRKIKQA
jgi:hypothetical protein